MTSLRQWLLPAPKRQYPDPYPGLPDPNQEPTPEAAATCAAANAAVEELALPSASASRKRKREVYSGYSDAFRLKVARFAIESTATRAAAKFGPELGRKLNESTVRGWVKTYKTQIQKVIT